MTNWNDIEADAPDLAEKARALFDAHKHKTIATLRKDGSPRISGIELEFKDGDLWLGSMPGARKAQDLLRDPRFSLHSSGDDPDTDDPTSWPGDAKVSGTAVEVTDPAVLEAFTENVPPGPFHLFKLDITELVVTRVDGDPPELIVDYWTSGGGRKTAKR